jgi:hypothetical protein
MAQRLLSATPMNLHDLKKLFARALGLASPLVLAGCGSTVDAVKYQPAPCTPQGTLSVTDIKPAVIPDLVQLWSLTGLGSSAARTLASQTGTACATAADQPGCRDALAGLKPTSGFGQHCLEFCVSRYLLTTTGDAVQAHQSLRELTDFLGTIDTAQEAVLIADANGYNVSCSDIERGAVRELPGGGYEVVGTKGIACGANTQVTRFFLKVKASGVLTETSSEVVERGQDNCAIGRRPHGLCKRQTRRDRQRLGQHFAVSAHLEAASVTAFFRLRDELAFHGAPVALQNAAVTAAKEEEVHARVTRALALSFGSEPEQPVVREMPMRSLFDVALDNAVEGCVRETFGALLAHHQAERANDPQIRRAMKSIADDETRHAALSWKIDVWARSQLSAAQRTALDRVQRQAIEMLREELSVEPANELVEEAGLPTAQTAVALAGVLEQQLWARAV